MAPGSRVQITLLGHEDEPFEGMVQSVGWGIFVPDGSSGTSTSLLPAVSPTIDWVRLAQRFPVRIRVQEKMSGALAHRPNGFSRSLRPNAWH
jgi:multidrug resistance efflux pump